MAGLPRSEVSFRRQGSSGLVWDDKFLSGDLSQAKPTKEHREATAKEESREPLRPSTHGTGSAGNMPQSPSSAAKHSFWTAKVPPPPPPAVDPPPSPKVLCCGLCPTIGKPATTHQHKPVAASHHGLKWGTFFYCTKRKHG